MTEKAKSQGAVLPTLVVFEPKTRDIVIGSVKLVLRRLKNKNVIPGDPDYADLLRDPAAMHTFVERFKENRDVASDLAVTARGQPATGDGDELICKVTLSQIERVLVYTCAKKRCAALAKVKSDDKPKSSAEIPQEIKNILGFAWQLPLLDTYLGTMQPNHFRALGHRLLWLKTPEALAPFAQSEPSNICQAEKAMGEDFDDMVRLRPAAVRSAAVCSPKQYALIKSESGAGTLDLLATDRQVFVELLGEPRDRLVALAPFASEMCVETYRQIEAVPAGVLSALLVSFRRVLGDISGNLLGDPEFARKFLFDVVGSVRSMKVSPDDDKDQAVQIIGYKWDAIEAKITEWWQSQGIEQRPAA